MKTKTGLACMATAMALVLGAPAARAADALTIVSWGGAYQASQQNAYFKPYVAKTGAKITEEEYNGEIAKIRAMVESKNVTWDVVDVDTATVIQACDEGLLEPIDWSKVGAKEKFIGSSNFECGVPTILYSTVFAYDTTKFKEGPTKIADLFDLTKFPGKRALQKTAFGNLEFALLADGVPPAEVYNVLATPEGVDRAFKKLDTVKKSVVWWEAGAQPPQLLADGEVVMTTAWNGRIQKAIDVDKKPFKIVWDGQLPDYDLWAIPKGSKNLDAAYRFIAFASSPEQQAIQPNFIAYGPANEDAVPKVAKEVLPKLPNAPANMTGMQQTNFKFWGDHRDELEKRFTTWLAQ
jgi:putative spermidine/putrescine transport system substrate-binding protein